MGDTTKIQWTDATWNPTRGCSRVSEGCRYCYAERVAMRQIHDGYKGLVHIANGHPAWTGVVRAMTGKTLKAPLHWRKPRRVFVNSMSDLFHEALPDEAIDRVFAVMALCPQHSFQCLTKRPKRMLKYFEDFLYRQEVIGIEAEAVSGFDRYIERGGCPPRTLEPRWTLPFGHVWLGISAEDQKTWDERTAILEQVPAAVRFVSLEPQLEYVDVGPVLARGKIHWLVQGGESGPGARPFNVEWARDAKKKSEGYAAYFLKQFGADPYDSSLPLEALQHFKTNDRKGGDMSEWSSDLRVREFPK